MALISIAKNVLGLVELPTELLVLSVWPKAGIDFAIVAIVLYKKRLEDIGLVNRFSHPLLELILFSVQDNGRKKNRIIVGGKI